MNRRDFLKFFGKATVATGVVAVIGLPEVDEVDFEGTEYLDRYEPSKEAPTSDLYFLDNDSLYVSGSFSVSPLDIEPKIVKWNSLSWDKL